MVNLRLVSNRAEVAKRKAVTLKVDVGLLARLRAQADRRGLKYSRLLWSILEEVLPGLESEKIGKKPKTRPES